MMSSWLGLGASITNLDLERHGHISGRGSLMKDAVELHYRKYRSQHFWDFTYGD